MLKIISCAVIFLTFGALMLHPAHAANRNALIPLPSALVPAVEKAFDLHDMTPMQVQQLTLTRKMNGHVYACFVGANLPCGKADIATHQPAITKWCSQNPNADFVPAYVTGHETAYIWRCTKGQADIIPPSAGLDTQGYFTDYWRRVK